MATLTKKLSPEQFRERLFAIMDRKHHWAWPQFSGNTITKDQLKIFYRQEYAVYVRDFAVLLARVHGKNPPRPIRKILAKNLYEEDAGGLSLGQPHPDLFLIMMVGLGFNRAEFRDIELLSNSRAYREWLDAITSDADWIVGAAVLTIFVEGSANDRQEILKPCPRKTPAEIEDIVMKHPLVQYHGVPPEFMDLVRAGQMVDPGHRLAAYNMITSHTVELSQQQTVLDHLEQALKLWLHYRDGIARACGLRES